MVEDGKAEFRVVVMLDPFAEVVLFAGLETGVVGL